MTLETGLEPQDNNVNDNSTTPLVQEKIIEFSNKERIMSFLTFVMGFLFIHLTVWNVNGYFTTAFFVVLISLSSYYMKRKGHNFLAIHIAILIILLLFSTVYSITSNTFIKFLNTVFLIVGVTYYIYLLGYGRNKIGRYLPLEIITALLKHPLKNFSKQMAAINSTMKQSRFNSNIRMIILGLVLAIPITLVVGCLLMSADNGVNKFIQKILENISINNMWIWILEILISIPVGCYIFSTIYSNTHRDDEENLSDKYCEEKLNKLRTIHNTILYTAITPICFLYIVFFISQINYFLSAFLGNLPVDYNYSQYARKGFFELIVIEIINIGVIAFINTFAKKSGAKKAGVLKFYNIIISFFTLVIIATAISKMVMYIDEYGLTQLRVYTTWFMILTAFIYLLIIIKQFKFNLKFSQWGTGIFIVMFAVLCFSRPDALIAKYNLTYRAEEMSESDIENMIYTSDDSASVILDSKYSELFSNNTEEDARYQYLCSLKSKYTEDSYSKYNISALKIKKEIEKMRINE